MNDFESNPLDTSPHVHFQRGTESLDDHSGGHAFPCPYIPMGVQLELQVLVVL